jgi:hypothetical protein
MSMIDCPAHISGKDFEDLKECIEVIKRYRKTRDWHQARSEWHQDRMYEQNKLVVDAILDLKFRFLALYPEGNVEQFFLESGIA